MKTFEDYLREAHAKQYKGLDDEMYEDFLLWADEEIGTETLFEWHEEWLKIHDLDVQIKTLKDFKTNLL